MVPGPMVSGFGPSWLWQRVKPDSFSPILWVSHLLAVVQSLSWVWFCTPIGCSSTPGLHILHCVWSSLKFMPTESMMPSNHLTFCHPLLLPSMFPNIRVFSNESALCIRWPKYWSFSFSISLYSSEYSELISCRMDWLDLLEVQGTLKSLLQHHSLEASILQHSIHIL